MDQGASTIWGFCENETKINPVKHLYPWVVKRGQSLRIVLEYIFNYFLILGEALPRAWNTDITFRWSDIQKQKNIDSL